ncbi:MAG: hypothetical protein RL094_102 [Candidatus Parcubacteria bacterium]|jgi:hypothetical protein
MVEWNTVTWYSKIATLVVLLGVVPTIAFLVGSQYGLTILTIEESQLSNQTLVVPASQREKQLASSTKGILAQVQKSLVGTWQSLIDKKYVVIFSKSGELREEYRDPEIVGDPTVDRGTWKVLGEFQMSDLQLTTDFSDGAFLKKVFVDGHAYNYKVVRIGTSTLELMYLDTGKLNKFTKVK